MTLRPLPFVLLSCLASFPAFAECERDPLVDRLHRDVAFDVVDGLDVVSVPGQGPLITFYGRVAGEPERALWLHRCLDDACSPGTTVKLDTWNFFDGDTDVLLRADGRPLIVNNQDQRAALFDCADPACTSGVNRPTYYAIGPLNAQGALRSNGLAVVAYVDQYARSIDMAVCQDAICQQTTRVNIAPIVTSALPTIEMRLTSDDRPVVAVSNFGDGAPHVDLIICESPACLAPVTRRVAAYYGYYLDLAIRSDDLPVVHFTTQLSDNKLVVCNDLACTAPQTRDPTGFTYGLTLKADDVPLLVTNSPIGYYECADADCSSQGALQQVGSAAGGGGAVLALDADGRPFVAWWENATMTVNTASCAASDIRRNGFEPSLDSTPAVVTD